MPALGRFASSPPNSVRPLHPLLTAALSVSGVATVVLGVKNRLELDECVAAEARGPLSAAERSAVDALTSVHD